MVKHLLILILLVQTCVAQPFTLRDIALLRSLATISATNMLPSDITNGLIARYSLAGNVNDSASTNNGTASGSPTYTTGPRGAANGAISLNGFQYVTLGHPTIYDFGTNDFTFVAWINTTSVSVNQMIFTCDYDQPGGSLGRQFNFDINGNGGNGSIEGVTFEADLQPSNPPYSIYSTASGVITSGTWYQVILVKSGNSPGAFKLSINGVMQTFTRYSGFSTSDFPITMNTTTSDVEIGRREYTGATSAFTGALASVSVYNRAFSETECTNSYSYGPK